MPDSAANRVRQSGMKPDLPNPLRRSDGRLERFGRRDQNTPVTKKPRCEPSVSSATVTDWPFRL